jgi:excinuclease UvrABC helicase subunit UvrB
MKFRNYCIVVMGDTLGVQAEIQKISETTPNVLDAKGILISTFSSLVELNELKEWFKENKRSFLIFDLDEESSGFHIIKKNIEDGLFGFLKNTNTNELTEKFAKAVEYSSITKTVNIKEKKISLEDQLKEALEHEDYEKAAKIRDILNKEKKV